MTLPRIAFVTTVYEGSHVGGGTFIRYLRRAVQAGELDLTFFSDDMGRDPAPFERRVEIPAAAAALPGGWVVRSRYYRRAVLEAHGDTPFDIVWHNNIITALPDVLLGTVGPVVGMINDYNNAASRTPWATAGDLGRRRAAIRFFWRQLERFCARHVQRVVVNSAYMAEQIRTAYRLVPERISLLYKAVDPERFCSTDDGDHAELRHGSASRLRVDHRILFVKSDYTSGGLFDLLEALVDFPRQVSLTVLGPPEDEHERILGRAETLGVRHLIERIARVPYDRIPSELCRHDVLCLPSRSEALGVALLEALAAGVPAIGGNVGGVPEVLDEGRAGWLVPPRDPRSLRRTLLEVLDGGDVVARTVGRGREHVGTFSPERMVRMINRVAQEVSSAKGPGP